MDTTSWTPFYSIAFYAPYIHNRTISNEGFSMQRQGLILSMIRFNILSFLFAQLRRPSAHRRKISISLLRKGYGEYLSIRGRVLPSMRLRK